MDSETVVLIDFTPYNWIKEAKIYNKKGEIITSKWLEENANIIVLLFTSKGIDREGTVRNFYSIYENVKMSNVAVEVIYIPFDETDKDYNESYAEQANWFTLRYADPLIFILQYAYGITCVPFMVVVKPDCTVISWHGLSDIQTYGKNAIITWLTNPVDSVDNRRRASKELHKYGVDWKYASTSDKKKPMQRRFSDSLRITNKSEKK